MPQRPTETDQQRFSRLVRPHLTLLLRTAGYLTGDAHAAEDLAQETAMRAMRGLAGFRDGTDIRAWLLTILRRTHVDLHRREKRHRGAVPLDEALAPAAPPAEEDPAGMHDEQWPSPRTLLERFGDAEVIAALKALPEAIRWTLLLVDVEQLEHAQAAAVLGVAVGTIKSRAHRGRAMLRDRLYDLAVGRGWVDAPTTPAAREHGHA